jgi:hypothetical protein
MYNDLPIRVTIRAVGASNPDAGGPPPNVMPLHAPRCKAFWALHERLSRPFYTKWKSQLQKSQLPKCLYFEQPTEFRFLQQCAVLDPAGAALQRPHKPPSSAALGASDPNLSLNQLAVSTAVSGWVGCASA